jgi:hypothetical protein
MPDKQKFDTIILHGTNWFVYVHNCIRITIYMLQRDVSKECLLKLDTMMAVRNGVYGRITCKYAAAMVADTWRNGS